MPTRIPINEDQIRVSSVAGHDNNQFGKERIVDGNSATYWLSEKMQGAAQWIIVKFHDKVKLDEVRIQFEPGLSAKSMSVRNMDPYEKELEMFFPDDTNSLQVIPIPHSPSVHNIKIAFDCSTDFFGRIAVKSLEFYGA
ncbi:nuclear receptor 2C2-associated protein-like [Paramacrobiotus metropolitanus]|uniref:nuclear receptor 2C2-associated protein-like n=1 Tax=Paramacrobiotus metropolitanus TaxID=2943436 RepID=UPI002445E390|nr:nuclear receptor 2C2-associated protein-like [Paramacrobiotus metropolitanus]